MRTPRYALLATFVTLTATVARPADDPIAATSIGRFSIEAFALPVGEQVNLCSEKYPALQSALTAASAELRERYVAQLAEMLRTERFAPLLTAEVPNDLFQLNRQQSAMRRTVNTTISQERCERTLGEFTQMSDQLLQFTIGQLLSSTKSIIDRNASRSRQ
jgi:hypothetical protein